MSEAWRETYDSWKLRGPWDNHPDPVEVACVCRVCGAKNTLEVDADSYDQWQGGVFVQDAFPDLSAAERELLISGTCDPCFRLLFADDEDEVPAHEWTPRYKDGDGGLCAVCDRDCRNDEPDDEDEAARG